MIQFNSQNTFKEIHYDGHDIKYAYGGCSGDLVWEKEPQPFGGKFKLTLNDSSTVSADCSPSNVVTMEEVSSQYSGTVVSAEIGNCCTSIGQAAFYKCSGLTNIVISDSVLSIETDAFHSCYNLTSVNIPSGVTSIPTNTFYDCTSLPSIDIPDNVTEIGWAAFQHCFALTSVTIPNTVTTIGREAFDSCSGLTEISIPDSVVRIGTEAFEHCSSLTSCTIGSGVTSINNNAFSWCTSLTGVTVEAVTPPTLGEFVFENTYSYPIYVPAESVDAYKTATRWSSYADRIQAIS